MPKLPMLTAQGGGPITQGEPGVFRLPAISPEAYGVGLGRGLTELGEGLAAADSRLRDQRDRIQLSEMSMQLAVRMDEAKERILHDNNIPFDQKAAQLASESSTMLREIEETGGSGPVRAAFRAHATNEFGQARIDLSHEARKIEGQQQLLETDRLNDWKMDRAAQLPLTGINASHSDVLSLGQQVDHLLEATVKNGLLHPAEAEKKRTELLNRYWEQYAANYPEHMKAIEAGGVTEGHPIEMDARQLRRYGNIADQMIAGRHAEEDRARKEAERQLKAEQMTTQNSFIDKLTKNTLRTKEILASNLDPVGEGSKEHYIHLLEAKAKAARSGENFHHDPAVFAKTLEDIRKERITTEAEVEQVFMDSVKRNRGITWEDTVKLRTEVDDVRTPEGSRLGKLKSAFLSGVEAQINKSNPLMGVLDPSGRQKFYEFSHYVDEKVNELRHTNEDPHTLFDPKSPKYLGAPGVLIPFQKTTQESMKDLSERLKRKPEETIAPPRLEQETPDKYLERMKKK